MTVYITGQQASCSKTITETDFVLFAGLSGILTQSILIMSMRNKLDLIKE